MGESDSDDKDQEDRRSILQRRAAFVASALASLALISCGEEPKGSPGPCLSVARKPSETQTSPTVTAPTASASPSATAGLSGSAAAQASAIGSAFREMYGGSGSPNVCLTMSPPMPKKP